MAFDFPASPTVGQKYTYGNITYIWNGYGWIAEPIPDFVNVEGDTMTGALTIRTPGTLGQLILDNPVVTDVTTIGLKKNNTWRWSLNATAGPEPGAEVGTNFSIRRYNDAGTLFGDIPFNINRATGRAQVGQNPVNPMDVATKAYVDATFGGGGPGYLPLTGGTLSGALSAPNYYLDATSGQADLYSRVNGSVRWLQRMTDNYELHRYDNAGAYLGSPLQISRTTGIVNLSQGLQVTGHLASYTSFSTPSGTITNLSSDNANIVNCTSYGTFNLTAVSCNTLTANAITDYGTLTVHGAATMYSTLVVSANAWVLGGNISINGAGIHTTIHMNTEAGNPGAQLMFADSGAPWYGGFSIRMRNDPNTSFTVYGSGSAWSSYGYNGKGGIYGGPQSNCWNFEWGDGLWAWIDNTNLGRVVTSSDYRIKRNVENLSTMWAKVRALRPVKFNLQDYSPASPKGRLKDRAFSSLTEEEQALTKEEGRDIPDVRLPPDQPLVKGDEIEHWGFIAHELQETLVMDAATGVKDQMDLIQAPNPLTIIAALTKALQEAMTRIETLELRLGIVN